MNQRNNIVFMILLLSGNSHCLFSQDMQPATSQMVRIESEPSGAELYVHDSLIGRTPMNVHRKHLPGMTAWYPSRNSWGAEAQDLPDSAISYLEGVVVLVFSRNITVQSVPSNAAVYEGDSLIGRTPLLIASRGGSRTLVLSKPGYTAETIVLHDDSEGSITSYLEADEFGKATPEVRELNGSLKLPPVNILAAAATGLGAGIAAVILKREADARYTTYQRFGVRDELDASRRYDLYSGVALAMLQFSLAYLVYELFITP